MRNLKVNMASKDLDRALRRITRTALRRATGSVPSSSRLIAFARAVVRSLPNSESLDHGKLVGYVAGKMRCTLQAGDSDHLLSSADVGDTVVKPTGRTTLAG